MIVAVVTTAALVYLGLPAAILAAQFQNDRDARKAEYGSLTN